MTPTAPTAAARSSATASGLQRHYLDSGVFIRSVSTRGQAGGLPRIVKSLVRLLDAAGKDIILVETVGVGQSELGIMGVADTVLVALMPESGDTIQTLKAGVMEIADIFLVNKADREGGQPAGGRHHYDAANHAGSRKLDAAGNAHPGRPGRRTPGTVG